MKLGFELYVSSKFDDGRVLSPRGFLSGKGSQRAKIDSNENLEVGVGKCQKSLIWFQGGKK